MIVSDSEMSQKQAGKEAPEQTQALCSCWISYFHCLSQMEIQVKVVESHLLMESWMGYWEQAFWGALTGQLCQNRQDPSPQISAVLRRVR